MVAVKEKVEKVVNSEEDPIEILEPEVKEKIVILGKGDETITFIQKPLTFFGKIEFFSIMGKAIERVLSEGGSVSEIIDSPEGNPLDQSSAKEADLFIKSIAKVVQYAPETLLDIYCVVLAVPRGEKEYVKIRLEEDLTDEQGFGIIDTFVDQNWEVLTSFFTERGVPLYQKITQKFQK